MTSTDPEEGVPLQMMETGQQHLSLQEDMSGHKIISTRNRMGMVGFLAVLAGMAIVFSAEEGFVEEKTWSNEMEAIANATKRLHANVFRYALMDDMTWPLAKEGCLSISSEYELCTVDQLCSQTTDGLRAHTLCQPAAQCEGLEQVGGLVDRWAPVKRDTPATSDRRDGAAEGEWVNVEESCKVGQLPSSSSPPCVFRVHACDHSVHLRTMSG